MPDNNEWKVPGVFADNCALRKEAEELRRTLVGHNVQINNQYRELKDLRECNERQARQLSSLSDDLAQANRDRDKAMNMAEDRQRRMENAEKEVERLIGISRVRAQRITNLENALKRPGDEDSHLAPVQGLHVDLLTGVTKGVNGLHAVGQVIGHLQLSRKDTRNVGHWLINSVREELE